MIYKGNEITDISRFREDTFIENIVNSLLSSDKIPRLINVKTYNEFIDKFFKANFIFIKYLPIGKLNLYKTNEIDIGYTDKITIKELVLLMSTNKIKKDIPVYLEYMHGNIFAYIDYNNIETKLLLREDIYVLIHNKTKEVYNISIGNFGNPNRLYYRSDLNNIKTTLNKVITLQGLNRINIYKKIDSDFI